MGKPYRYSAIAGELWNASKAAVAEVAALVAHLAARDNPHAVTAAQAGAATAAQGALADTAVQPSGLAAALSVKADSSALSGEAAARQAADTTLQANIDAEATARTTADTTLQAAITSEASRATAAESAEASARAAADTTEAAARLAADIAQMTGRRYYGGVSTFAAEAARAGFSRYGLTLRLGPFYASGACVPVQMGGLSVSLTDADSTSARVQVSLANGGGTATVRTTTRAWPLNAWRTLHVVSDTPVNGLISAASLHLYIDGVAVATEVVADASGAPLTTASAWTLGADSAGFNSLSGVIARYGWQVYNYAMTAAQVAAWHQTSSVPYAGAGTMQALTNGSFDSYVGTADDGVSDTFPGWTTTLGSGAVAEAVSGGDAYALKITCPAGVGANTYQPLRGCAGARVIVSFLARGDGTHAGSSAIYNTVTSSYAPDTSGTAVASTGVTAADTWVKVERVFDLPHTGVFYLYFIGVPSGSCQFDAVQVVRLGNMTEGLDLAAQPVCSRTALGSVLYDSASGVAPQPDVRPIQTNLATPVPLTADGYLIGDRATHPAGYAVASVYVTNSGSASVTATIRAGSSSGTVIATGSIAATGLPIVLTVSSISALTAAGGKIYIAGATTSAPLTANIILQRI